MADVDLTSRDQAALVGDHGPAAAMAMRIIVRLAEIQGAPSLIDVTRAHIDGCLYHGQAGLDFATKLVDLGAEVSIPTTLNVGNLDLLHPELTRSGALDVAAAKAHMDAYLAMGCRPTWTCAPYQLPGPPGFGEQVAWAESNAIVYANSVLGARTNRYGDLIDICAAITGRVPLSGLHTDGGRRATITFRLGELPDRLAESDALFPILGFIVGRMAGAQVAAITGLASATSDQLKALGAAAASSGGVALVHVVGVTPEAPSLEAVLADNDGVKIDVTAAMLRRARDELTTGDGSGFRGVSLGTPHASYEELAHITELLDGRKVHGEIDMYVSTARDVLARAEDAGIAGQLREAGSTIVTDTCTYIAPVVHDLHGTVMTDSAKWAFYAPGIIGVDVIFGSTAECVDSAVAGRPVYDMGLWDG